MRWSPPSTSTFPACPAGRRSSVQPLQASPSSPAGTSSRTRAARARSASRTASSPPRRSQTGSLGSRRARRRYRYSCEATIPDTSPIVRLRRITQISETLVEKSTKWTCTWVAFSSTNATTYATARDSATRRTHTSGPKLPRSSCPSRWGRRSFTPGTLRRCVRDGQTARHEPRLGQRRKRPGLDHPERGADLLAGQSAQARLAEIAIVARCAVLLAHKTSQPPVFARFVVDDLGPDRVRKASVFSQEN